MCQGHHKQLNIYSTYFHYLIRSGPGPKDLSSAKMSHTPCPPNLICAIYVGTSRPETTLSTQRDTILRFQSVQST